LGGEKQILDEKNTLQSTFSIPFFNILSLILCYDTVKHNFVIATFPATFLQFIHFMI